MAGSSQDKPACWKSGGIGNEDLRRSAILAFSNRCRNPSVSKRCTAKLDLTEGRELLDGLFSLPDVLVEAGCLLNQCVDHEQHESFISIVACFHPACSDSHDFQLGGCGWLSDIHCWLSIISSWHALHSFAALLYHIRLKMHNVSSANFCSDVLCMTNSLARRSNIDVCPPLGLPTDSFPLLSLLSAVIVDEQV